MGTRRHPEGSELDMRLLELVDDPVVLADRDGRIERVNAAMCVLAGRSEDELVGTSVLDLVDPADRREAAARWASPTVAAAEEREPALQTRIRRPDGSAAPIEMRAAIDPAGGFVLMTVHELAATGDVDLEPLAEAFRHAPLGMALMAPEGTLLGVNDALCRTLGTAEGELLAARLPDLLDDAQQDDAWAGLRDNPPPSFQTESRLRRPDGAVVIALVSGTLLQGADEAPVAYLCQIVDITERTEAQERLAANEAKLAEAQQIARLGSWEWEIASDRVTWSDELYRIYGVRPDRVPGSYGNYLDRIHDDDRARVARGMETAVADRRPWSIDYRIVRPDGDVRMIHARGEVVCDDDERPVVVHGTCQDVTESRRVEDALRAAEQLFRRAFDDAPIGMALIDLEGRWLRLNGAICQMLGRDEQELRTMRLTELNHPDDRDLDRPLMDELLAGRRRSFAIEKRYRRADDDLIHALVHVSLMHGDGERPLYFLCQLVDVTERRRAEAERQAGEERLQAIIDASPALIIVKDLEGRYLLVNRRWQELFGMEAEEAIGRTTEEVIEPERRPDHDALDVEVMQHGRMLETMTTIRAAQDDDEHTYLMLKFPLRKAEGEPYAVCTIATDITERRRSAEDRAELEHRLAQAQRLESVGQLAGGVAHDFNNLLSVILTCVGFAERELAADHPVREDVEEIGRAAERAAALTRQLLMFSRREVARREVLDIGALVRDLERLLNRTLSERIALRIAVGPGVSPIVADRAQLEQVLVNLAVNARDALPDGGTLSIAVAGAPEGVRITVADDGVGMTPDVRDHAFEPFFTTKAAGEGTGLGLATVHGIVTDSGGTVEIDSAPGRGTAVTIVLPAAAAGAVVREEPPAPGERARGEASVLVVEDQDPVRRQARRILETHGYTVREAAGGEQALAEWEPVDVLVTDVVMPGLTGHELAQLARERSPGLRVVFMSGHTEDVLVRDGAREGDLSFVQKPFTRNSLLLAVEEALEQPPGLLVDEPSSSTRG